MRFIKIISFFSVHLCLLGHALPSGRFAIRANKIYKARLPVGRQGLQIRASERKWALLFFFFLLISSFYIISFAQSSSTIDSLEKVLKRVSKKEQPKILNLLSKEHLNSNFPEKATEYANKALELAKKDNNNKEEAISFINLGRIYRTQNNLEKALEYFNKSLQISVIYGYKEEANDAFVNIGFIYNNWGDYEKAYEYTQKSLKIKEEIGDKKGISDALNIIANIHYKKGDFEKSIECYEKELRIDEEIGEKMRIAITLNNIGLVYYKWGKFERAIEYYQDALKIREEMNYKQGTASTLNNIGMVYQEWKQYEKALEYYEKSLKIKEEINDMKGMGSGYNNIGCIYEGMKNYDKAEEYYQKALKIYDDLGNKHGFAKILNNLGEVYYKQEIYQLSLDYFQRSLKINREIGNKEGIVISSYHIGDVYFKQKNYQNAMDYYNKSLQLAQSINLSDKIVSNYLALSNVYSGLGNYQKSLEFHKLYNDTKDSIFNADIHKQIAELQTKYETEKKEKEIKLKDLEIKRQSAVSSRQRIVILFVVCGLLFVVGFSVVLYRQFIQKKKANILLAEQKQKIEIQAEELRFTNIELEKLSIVASETDNAVIIADANGEIEWVNAGFTRLMGYSLDEYKQTRGHNLLQASFNPNIKEIIDECITQKKSAIYTTLDKTKWDTNIWVQTTLTPILDENKKLKKLVIIESDITKIKLAEEEIRQKNKDITDSINYARRIQSAILPSKEHLNEILNDYFILYKPREIVSGDFYWAAQVDEKIVIAVADCTGHGVPGAFMSLLGLTFLDEIVKNKGITQPAFILNFLRENIISALHQKGRGGETQDGMDIALITLTLNSSPTGREDKGEGYALQYAGANNPLWLVKNVSHPPQLVELKPDKMPIGIYKTIETPFTTQTIQLDKSDTIYMFSDGYPDQFGGPHGKKFMYSRFRQLIFGIQDKSLSEQQQILDKTIKDWMGYHDQIDDIIVMGVRI